MGLGESNKEGPIPDRSRLNTYFQNINGAKHASLALDSALFQKISKHHFFKDIQNFFHWVADVGPEPHQFFFFSNISTNMVARGIQSFGQNGPWLAG